MTTLGQRIKYFRKRANLSQFQLELEISASAGSISRIESGEVNPTKETLQHIAEVLKLNIKEFNYLNGQSDLVSQEEIKLAITEIKEYFGRKGVLAYLIDDRWRFLYYSQSFKKLLGFNDQQSDNFIGKTLINIILDEEIGMNKFLRGEDYEELLNYQFSRFYQEAGFMEGDPVYLQSLSSIKKDPQALKVWVKVQEKKEYLPMHTLKESSVNMNVMGAKVNFYIVREFMHKYPRFEVIEFIPTNKAVRLLSKLLG